MVDMRKRFRGNLPISTSVELEGGGGRQLYGGREAGGAGIEGRGGKKDGVVVEGLGFDEGKTRGL
jgi:hypothetical protein